jgi:pentatricopeptide repeat protein
MKVFGTNSTREYVQNNRQNAHVKKAKRKTRFFKASSAAEYSVMGDEALRNRDYANAIRHYWKSINSMSPMDENVQIQDLSKCKKMCVVVSTLIKISEAHLKDNKKTESISILERAESMIGPVVTFDNLQENGSADEYNVVQYSSLTLFSKVLETKGDFYVSEGDLTAAEEGYLNALSHKRSAINIIRTNETVASLFSAHKDIDLELATILKKLGRVLQRRGNYKESVLTYSEALLIRQECQQDNTATEVAQLLQHLSEVCREIGDYESALQHVKSLEKYFKKRDSRATLVKILIEKSKILSLQKKYALSMNAATSALDIANGNGFEHSEGPLLRASATEQVAKVLEAQYKYDDAILWHKKAHTIRSSALSISHPLVLQSAKCIAQIYCSRGEYDRAKTLFKEMRDKVIGTRGLEEHVSVADILDELGLIYSDQKNFSAALKYHKRALEIRRVCSPSMILGGVETLGHVACLQLETGNRLEAMTHFSEALDVLRKNHCCSSHPLVIKTIRNMTAFDHVEDELESISVKL